ncbi:GntR family transcriptional regulator [uncultured Cohaesibacter sp.]|uniref:GntR family transcriptional regulator n=1 Tax=uncultured Cohaesibacter sp. TaxID=1002546 RepID=UPI002A0A52C0|nr:GntR family transcriptional regulator [uncultured Cohaesibacter sp.]
MTKKNIDTVLSPLNRLSVADSVFDELHRQILTLELQPGAKISESDVAKALGVSRQPVRDAFYRLSKLGFLSMRPQVATTVSLISKKSVEQARFIRCALETKTVVTACEKLTPDDLEALRDLIEQQRKTVVARDAELFHALDDQFHKEICDRCGVDFAWQLIKDNKAHMDRVRFLSLTFAIDTAFAAHKRILSAIESNDPAAASAEINKHLGEILLIIPRIREEHPDYFAIDEE